MTDHSILLPFLPRRPEQILVYAGLVKWTGARRLWQGHSALVEAAAGFAFAAGAGLRVSTGIGVALMPLQHPYLAAHHARSLALATGEPVVMGFGPGARTFQTSVRGRPYRNQLAAVREYVAVVRGLLDGHTVEVDGDYVTCHAAMTPAITAPIEIGLGVLRSGMARLAGEVADVAITWLTPPDYLRDIIVPALDEGAAAAGRPRPRVCAMVPVALRRPDRDIVATVLAGNAAHLQAAHYVTMLERAGITIGGVDPASDARRLVAGGAFLHGDLDEVTQMVSRYHEAGVDEVVLNATGAFRAAGPAACMDELKALLENLSTVREAA